MKVSEGTTSASPEILEENVGIAGVANVNRDANQPRAAERQDKRMKLGRCIGPKYLSPNPLEDHYTNPQLSKMVQSGLTHEIQNRSLKCVAHIRLLSSFQIEGVAIVTYGWKTKLLTIHLSCALVCLVFMRFFSVACWTGVLEAEDVPPKERFLN